MTRRLAKSAERLCEVMAIRHVERFFGLDWKTVEHLDRRRLESDLGPVELDGREVIAPDEFAIQTGRCSSPTCRASWPTAANPSASPWSK